MATFVLVHGTTAGGWVWKDIARPLREAGHEVYTPTLTGLGERMHLLTPDVGLDTHITDIVNVIRFEELRDVVLVGHSYGGSVITEAGVHPNVAGLVYVAAHAPDVGEDHDRQLAHAVDQHARMEAHEREGQRFQRDQHAHQADVFFN